MLQFVLQLLVPLALPLVVSITVLIAVPHCGNHDIDVEPLLLLLVVNGVVL